MIRLYKAGVATAGLLFVDHFYAADSASARASTIRLLTVRTVTPSSAANTFNGTSAWAAQG
jgi:hypothetical protein